MERGRSDNAAAFRDRRHVGRVLADLLAGYADQPNVLVLAPPPGGIAVACEVARTLRAPLDVFVVRKLAAPGHEDCAMGALASGGMHVVYDTVVRLLRVSDDDLEAVTRSEQRELARRESLYRAGRPALDVRGLTVILVDDGVTASSTVLIELKALRAQGTRRLVVALPTATAEGCEEIRHQADEVICAAQPGAARAFGPLYNDLSETTDDEVLELLAYAEEARHATH